MHKGFLLGAVVLPPLFCDLKAFTLKPLTNCLFSVFAFGESYLGLFVARSLQGVASACIGVSGKVITILSKNYKNNYQQ